MKPTATPLALKRPSLLLLPRPLPSSLLHLENCLLWGVLPFSLLHFCFVFLLIPSLFNSLATLLVYFFSLSRVFLHACI